NCPPRPIAQLRATPATGFSGGRDSGGDGDPDMAHDPATGTPARTDDGTPRSGHHRQKKTPSPKKSGALYYHGVPARTPRHNQVVATGSGEIDQMVEKFVTELEAAVEEMVQSRLREVVQSLYGGEGAPGGRAKSQSVADLRAAFGLPAATIVATAPALLSAGRIGEPTRARPG